MEKTILAIIIILISFGLGFAKDDSTPRELTPKERREVCRDMSNQVKAYQKLRESSPHGLHNIKRAEVKCLGNESRNILIVIDGMTEKEAYTFFPPRTKEELRIAGYHMIYYKDFEGNMWTEDLR